MLNRKTTDSRYAFSCNGLIIVLFLGVTSGFGCRQELNPTESAGKTSNSSVVTKRETQERDDNKSDNSDVLEQASDLLGKAKDPGGISVSKAADWLQSQLDGAAETGSSTAEGTLGWATEMYQSLKEQGLTTAGSTREWVADDWKNMGAWEYKVFEMEGLGPMEIEKKLTELGKQRWECFHVMTLSGNTRMFFKRPAKSYLKNVPLKDMMRLIPLLDNGNG